MFERYGAVIKFNAVKRFVYGNCFLNGEKRFSLTFIILSPIKKVMVIRLLDYKTKYVRAADTFI